MVVWIGDKTGWSQTLRMAHKCGSRGDYQGAIRHYEDALREGRNGTLIRNNMADAYMNLCEFDKAITFAEEAVEESPAEAVSYVTQGQVYQAKGQHKKALDCMIKSRQAFEESVPELRDMDFASIEEVIKKLPTRVKFAIASQDWIRLIYLVKSLRNNYQKERDYVRRGVSWEFLTDIRRKSLSSAGPKYVWSKEKLGIKGNGPAAIAATYGAMCAISGSPKVRVVEKNEKSSTIQISACWEYSVIRSMGLDGDAGWVECSRICAEQLNTIAQAINGEVRFEFTSTVPAGHTYCEGRFVVGHQPSEAK